MNYELWRTTTTAHSTKPWIISISNQAHKNSTSAQLIKAHVMVMYELSITPMSFSILVWLEMRMQNTLKDQAVVVVLGLVNKKSFHLCLMTTLLPFQHSLSVDSNPHKSFLGLQTFITCRAICLCFIRHPTNNSCGGRSSTPVPTILVVGSQ